MQESFLRVVDVTKRFANHTALDGVSIDVPRGKIFGLLGPNGAGKTTLIRIINHITLPDSGEVIFNGHQLTEADVPNIGYLPEERGLYKKMRVGEQAIYLAQLKGISRREATRRLKEWFERLEISSWWDRKLEELSKGMQQKVQFVITVLHEPSLLILDEPFSGFDPVNAELLKREILALRDRGTTVIFSTHNMASVEDVCDEMALINRSRVALSGSVEEVKERFRNGTFRVQTKSAELRAVPELFTVVDSSKNGSINTFTLRKREGASTADLVSAIAADVEIRSFSETMPTMQEIFLKVVGEEQRNNEPTL